MSAVSNNPSLEIQLINAQNEVVEAAQKLNISYVNYEARDTEKTRNDLEIARTNYDLVVKVSETIAATLFPPQK